MTVDTRQKVEEILERASRSGNPDEEFFYLGGPMSGYSKFNFDRFAEVAVILRNNGYNIITPNEMDDTEVLAESYSSTTGDHTELSVKYERLLARDIVILALPACVGGIFLENWEDSWGAVTEKYVLERLKKKVYLFDNDGPLGLPQLTALEPDEHRQPLSNAGAVMTTITKESDYAVSTG